MAYSFNAPDMAGTFAKIGELGNIYDRGRISGARNAISGLGPGNADQIAQFLFANGDIEGGLSVAKLAETQAQREHARAINSRDFNFRQQESNRSQSNSDRCFNEQQRQFGVSHDRQGIPPGYERATTDPNYTIPPSQANRANAPAAPAAPSPIIWGDGQVGDPSSLPPPGRSPASGLRFIPGGPADPAVIAARSPEKAFEHEQALRKEFEGNAKTYSKCAVDTSAS